MLKKYIWVFIVMCLVYQVNASAQVSGYQGKKLNLTYDFNFYHNLFKYLHMTDYLEYNGVWTAPRPTIKNGIGLEYVISRHSSIIANTSIFLSSIPTTTYFSYTDNTSWFGFSNDNEKYVSPSEETKIFAYNLGIHYRTYFKNKGLAPLGNFIDIGIERIGYKLNVSDNMEVYSDYYYFEENTNNYTISNSIPYTIKNWYSAYLLNVGFGTQRVIYNNFTCRYGVKSGWVIGGLWNKLFVNTELLTEENYFSYTSKNHLWKKNILQFDFGVGYLIK